MNILFILIPLSLTLASVGLCGFFWAIGNGQFDDLSKESLRILADLDINEKFNEKGEK